LSVRERENLTIAEAAALRRQRYVLRSRGAILAYAPSAVSSIPNVQERSRVWRKSPSFSGPVFIFLFRFRRPLQLSEKTFACQEKSYGFFFTAFCS
jgi:hypothetical protein